jgi:hypothetical protein
MRKILHIFLSLVIVYATTTSAYANTSIGGWTATDTIIAGANTTINAIKNGANGALKSAVTVAPQASKVGKLLIRGGGAAALLLAVPQLIGEGVDWVLDPENNSIKYTVPAQVDNSANDDKCRAWALSTYGPDNPWSAKAVAGQPGTYYAGKCVLSDNPTFELGNQPGYKAPVTVPAQDKHLPIDTVAAQVISNATAGDAPSQEAVKDTALEGFAAGEHDVALESAAVESDAGTDNPPDTTNPDNPAPTDPAAPFDPSSIIAAINALKALLAGILSSITGLADIFNDDPPPEKSQSETDVPVELPPEVKNATEFDVDYIGFSSQCPTLQPFSVGIGAASSSMTFDMTPLCELAVTIRPAIIAIAYFIGLGVIASAIRET